MEEKIASNPQVAIGEVGIDRRIPHMDVQIKIFQEILHLAVHYQRPVTLHVVRETGGALDLLKNQVQLPPLVIWHGFTGSIETAKELRKLGVEISLRPQVIRTKLVHNLEELNTLGFILETDWSGENDNGYEEVLNNHVKKMRELSNNEYIEEKCDGIRSILKDLQTNR
jgi:TatD DNase family protein